MVQAAHAGRLCLGHYSATGVAGEELLRGRHACYQNVGDMGPPDIRFLFLNHDVDVRQVSVEAPLQADRVSVYRHDGLYLGSAAFEYLSMDGECGLSGDGLRH